MKIAAEGLVYWTPRVICLAFAAFLSLFALDAFDLGYGVWQTLGALLMHLIPAATVLVVLGVVWRHEWVAAVLFPLLAALHIASSWGTLHPAAYLFIDGPLVLIGALFWISWRSRASTSPPATAGASPVG